MSNEETKERFQTLPENAQTTIETRELSKDQNDTIPFTNKTKKKKKKKKLSELELDSENDFSKTNYKFKGYFAPNTLS